VRDTVENGYVLWTFQGVRVHEATKTKMWQFEWRPRPAELLSEEEARDVAKNLRKHIQRYQEEDRAREGRKTLLARLRKRATRDEFRGLLDKRRAVPRPVAPGAAAADARVEEEVIEETYEVVVSETVEVVEDM
jgi:translation initiation factor 3 subunit B